MTLKISKQYLRQLFFSVCVIIPFFNNYEISFVFWVIALLFTIKKRYSSLFLSYLSHFILILLLALLVGSFYEYNQYFVIRDITYMLKPILGLVIGYQFFSEDTKDHFKFLLYAGIAMALIHLVLVLYGIGIMGARSVSDIRLYGGYFNDYEIYTLALLLFYKKFEIDITRKQYVYFLIILAVSSFFYLARTNFIQIVILFLALKGFLHLNKRSLTIFSVLFLLAVVGYTSIYYYNPKRNGGAVDEFLYKVKLIPLEAFSTKINREDWKDFHDHYRSYENVRTVEQLLSNETYIFGEGIGSQVDLKQKVFLGDMELRHISILHNGYMTVFLKSGIPGLLLLIMSIFFFFKKFGTINEMDNNINLLFVGTGLFLIVSYWVFLGLYNLLDSKSIFIGYLFAYKNSLRLKHNVIR
ncbi:O-antigen ligase family protein [Flavobacterium saliperosum]|uniref:O-Antigen ligase n=1 Tax=Flavobacterium saliperosum TaxID=329186 RepID=A0A1G4W4B3_9FLAO|nr:O-antigen ligase family protein [Flavobacterium saliperosum]SCX16078.1 O-Antigen ligase [Flavobacterium saliperosum]